MTGLWSLALQRHADGLTGILDAAIVSAASDFGSLQTVDRATGDLKLVAHRGFEAWWVEYWDRTAAGNGSCGAAFERRAPVIVGDVDRDPIFVGTPSHTIQLRAGVRACFSVPIWGRSGAAAGMMSAHYRAPFRPGPAVLRAFEQHCIQAAQLIDPAIVLLVDEDAEARAAFRKALVARRCTVVEASNDREALHRLSSDGDVPSLVLVQAGPLARELATAIRIMGARADIPLVVKPVAETNLDRFCDVVVERMHAPPPAAFVDCRACGSRTPKRKELTFCRTCGEPQP